MEVAKRALPLESGVRKLRTISIDIEVWEELNEVARSQGVSRNRLVEEMARATIQTYREALSEVA